MARQQQSCSTSTSCLMQSSLRTLNIDLWKRLSLVSQCFCCPENRSYSFWILFLYYIPKTLFLFIYSTSLLCEIIRVTISYRLCTSNTTVCFLVAGARHSLENSTCQETSTWTSNCHETRRGNKHFFNARGENWPKATERIDKKAHLVANLSSGPRELN